MSSSRVAARAAGATHAPPGDERDEQDEKGGERPA